jgi:hypothetical protein
MGVDEPLLICGLKLAWIADGTFPNQDLSRHWMRAMAESVDLVCTGGAKTERASSCPDWKDCGCRGLSRSWMCIKSWDEKVGAGCRRGCGGDGNMNEEVRGLCGQDNDGD